MLKHVRSRKTQPWVGPVIVAWLSLFSLGLIDNARGVIFPDLLREYQLTDTLGAFFFLVSSAASLIHNTVFHRHLSSAPPERIVGTYTLVMAIGCLLIALSPSFPVTLLACVVLGVGFGGLGVGQNVAVQKAPADVRQQALGLLHAMYGLSSFTSPLAMSVLVILGWRWAFALIAGPALVLGFAVWIRLRGGEKLVSGVKPTEVKKAIEHRGWIVYGAAAMVGFLVVAEISVSTRLSLLARRDWGVSLQGASLWLAVFFASMTMARMGLGLLRSAVSARFLLGFSLIAGLPHLVFGLMPIGLDHQIQLLLLAVYGFPIGLCYPLAMTRIAEIFGRDTQRVTSLCIVFQSACAMTMHFTLGWWADGLGLQKALMFVSIGALIAAGGLLFFIEKSQRNVDFS